MLSDEAIARYVEAAQAVGNEITLTVDRGTLNKLAARVGLQWRLTGEVRLRGEGPLGGTIWNRPGDALLVRPPRNGKAGYRLIIRSEPCWQVMPSKPAQ